MYSEDDEKVREVNQALAELTQLEAMKILLTNNYLGCEIHIAGMKMGVSDNSRLIPIVEAEMAEINLYLDGKPNLWE